MTQYDFGTINPDTKSGTQLAADLNSWRDALHSLHRGPSRPSYAVGGMLWIDDAGGASGWLLKMYDGDDADLLFATIDTIADTITFAGLAALAYLNAGRMLRVNSSDLEVESRTDSHSTNYTVLLTDAGKTITVDASSAARTVSLPNLSPADNGFRVAVKKMDATANAVTIEPDGVDTIDGQANRVLTARFEGVTILWTSGEWVTESGAVADGTLDLVKKGLPGLPGDKYLGKDAAGALGWFDLLKGGYEPLAELDFTDATEAEFLGLDFTGYMEAALLYHFDWAGGDSAYMELSVGDTSYLPLPYASIEMSGRISFGGSPSLDNGQPANGNLNHLRIPYATTPRNPIWAGQGGSIRIRAPDKTAYPMIEFDAFFAGPTANEPMNYVWGRGTARAQTMAGLQRIKLAIRSGRTFTGRAVVYGKRGLS